jgi:hypothetical protein
VVLITFYLFSCIYVLRDMSRLVVFCFHPGPMYRVDAIMRPEMSNKVAGELRHGNQLQEGGARGRATYS